jgi:hypothetical protein
MQICTYIHTLSFMQKISEKDEHTNIKILMYFGM